MSGLKKVFKRYFIDAMSAMALGLFSSLIIGLILSQMAKIPMLDFLKPFSEIINSSSPVVGGAIGAAIAWGLKSKPLVQFSCVVVGAYGYVLGGPVGAYIATVVAAEIGGILAGKTKLDIILSPMITIIAGGFVGEVAGPGIANIMTNLGEIINRATELTPVPMGIFVSILVGMLLTAPLSSAALCIMLELNGLAAGAAAIGCCANMIGFAVMSYKDNGIGGFTSVGIGTSMLQFSNAIRHPQLWIPPVMASAILGPISTQVLGMTNTPLGAGMGTSGFVGQIGAISAMTGTMSTSMLAVQIIVMHFLAPAFITLIFYKLLQKIGWIKPGYLAIKQE